MKTFAAISAIFLSVVALSTSQIITPYECHCGVFISLSQGEIEVFHMHPAHVEGCGTPEAEAACQENCRTEWTSVYKNGDLDAELSNGYSLGQEVCLGAVELFHPFINKENGQVFARNCEGNWEDIGLGTKQQICCNNGHYHEC